MNLNDFNKILVIISSRGHDAKKTKKLISKEFNKYIDKSKYDILLTQDEKSIINNSTEFAKQNPDSLIIVLGGDGSVNEAVNAIADEDIYFGFLPYGTGNDFARTVYPKMKLKDIIKGFNNIEIRQTDLIRVNDEYSVNATSFGYESIVLEKSLQIKKYLGRFNKLSILLGVLLTLNKIKPYRYSYEVKLANGKTITGGTTKIINAICNGKFYGTGFMPAPDADIDDGIIDINIVEYLGAFKLLSLMNKYKSEKHLGIGISHNYKVISGKIQSLDGPMIANNDGNIRYYTNIEFEVIPKKLKLAIFKSNN